MIACFFAPQFSIACERRRHPDLAEKPFALIGEEEILCAVSAEANTFGVQPGQKRSGATALCETLNLRPYDMLHYRAQAEILWDLLAIETSIVEPVSPEMAFILLRERSPLSICESLVEQMSLAAGCPVQAGLARTRTSARLAALRARSSSVYPVASDWEKPFLADIPIQEINEFDRPIRQQLEKLGVKRLGDLQEIGVRELDRQFPKRGLHMQRFALGLEYIPIRALWPPRSLQRTMRFDFEMNDLEMLTTVLREKAAEIAGELSIGREYCRQLRLDVKFEDGSSRSEYEKLNAPMDNPDLLGRAALRLWQRMTSRNEPQPLIEFTMEAKEISIASAVQLTLLDDNESATGLPHERKQRLESALSFVRRKFGEERVQPGTAMRIAGRIGLWTDPLGSRIDEPVIVEVGSDGLPTRFWRRGNLREIVSIQNRWKETAGERGNITEKMVYRVETRPLGFCEIYSFVDGWRLTSLAD